MKNQVKKPAGCKFFSPKTSQSKGKAKEEVPSKKSKLVTDSFDSGSEDDFDVLCNVVFVLPKEYDCVTKVVEPDDCEEEEMAKHKDVLFYDG